MRLTFSDVEFWDNLENPEVRESILKKIAIIGRTCYQSEACDGGTEEFVRRLVKRGHESVLEHVSLTVKFTVDRGISHEIVRHRIASFTQESTRYCNYSKGKFGNEITVIQPSYLRVGTQAWAEWFDSCMSAEKAYMKMLADECTPQEARAVLPTSLKTTLWMTANLREWRHFLKLRAAGATGKPHPQMAEVAIPVLRRFREYLPEVFGDILLEGETPVTEDGKVQEKEAQDPEEGAAQNAPERPQKASK